MAYSVLLAPPAERQLKALAESTRKRIVKRLKTFQHNPRPQGVKKLSGEDDLIVFGKATTGSSIRFKIRNDGPHREDSVIEKKCIADVAPGRRILSYSRSLSVQ